MSKRRSEEDYQKTFSAHFFRWLSGEKDPYLDQVEMKPQEEYREEEEVLAAHERDRQQVREHLNDLSQNREIQTFRKLYRVFSVVFCVAIISLLIYAVSYLPRTGTVDRPDNNEVAARYIESGLQETGAVNIVAGMILDYRAFDTFGESCVLFIAANCVLVLLRRDRKKGEIQSEDEKEMAYEPQNDMILQKTAFVLFPLIVMFGIYVILNGHISPGGGFSGGAIIGAGLMLYLNAYGFEKIGRFFTEKVFRRVTFCALTFYCLSKCYSFFTGANHLESGIPLGTPGAIISAGLILPLNICVGLVVACTMYAFFALFRKGGM